MPDPSKRLRKSRNRIIAGVCGGIAEWLGWDPTLVRVLYGGSLKPENAVEILAQPDIDGALVGGASLDAASFAAIVEAARA